MRNRLVVSPHLTFRFEDGAPLLCLPGRPDMRADAATVMLVSQFACAREPDDFQSVLALVEIGALISADRLDAKESSDRSTQTDFAETQRAFGALAVALYRVAGELSVFGPDLHADIAEETGIPIRARLAALQTTLGDLRKELRSRRDAFVARQLAELGVNRDATGLQLHLGAGPHRLAGWINMDVHPAEFAFDVRWNMPFQDGTARYVFLSHLLEHLYYPGEAEFLMKEVRRVLEPGGVVRIIVPDIEKGFRAYVDRDSDYFCGRREHWYWWTENETLLENLLAYAGAGPAPGKLFESHKFGYDFETLSRLLRVTGFSHVERSEYMESAHADLRHDDASAVAGAHYAGGYYSLFVEATA